MEEELLNIFRKAHYLECFLIRNIDNKLEEDGLTIGGDSAYTIECDLDAYMDKHGLDNIDEVDFDVLEVIRQSGIEEIVTEN